MPELNLPDTSTTNQTALNLLAAEHRSLVRLLHDDIGQSLAAIKSFAAAIVEQRNDAADNETADLATMVKQAAELTYQSAYNLMQELRSQDAAHQEIGAALATCLQDAGLKANRIDFDLHIDPDISLQGYFVRAFILRSVRCCINFSKMASRNKASLTIALHKPADQDDHAIELYFEHRGEFDIVPDNDPGFFALRERIEAIGGELIQETNNRDRLKLWLRFDSLFPEFEPVS